MTVVYGEDKPSYATVKRWAAEFCRGRRFEGEPRSRRPSEAACEENCHAVETVVLQNRRVNVHLIVDTVGISTGQVKMILHEFIMTKVCAPWVPRMLDQKMKHFLCKISTENLKFMQLNWNLFVKRIVTGDETRIHLDDLET